MVVKTLVLCPELAKRDSLRTICHCFGVDCEKDETGVSVLAHTQIGVSEKSLITKMMGACEQISKAEARLQKDHGSLDVWETKPIFSLLSLSWEPDSLSQAVDFISQRLCVRSLFVDHGQHTQLGKEEDDRDIDYESMQTLREEGCVFLNFPSTARQVSALAERRVLPRKILFIEKSQSSESARQEEMKSRLQTLVKGRNCKIDTMQTQDMSEEFYHTVMQQLLI
eukprot:762781-Hanusia_phi.AAC.9